MEEAELQVTDGFQIEQAIFTSSDQGSVKGYQLIAKSAGIDRDGAQILCRWAPTQFRGNDPDGWTLNVFPISDDLTAITRTCLGGPEYSGRGAAQVVTMILVVDQEQLAAYEFNTMLVAKNALTMGYLRLPLSMKHQKLSSVVLPAHPVVASSADSANDSKRHSPIRRTLDQAADLLHQDRRLAIVGDTDPMLTVDVLLSELPDEHRADISFTTGLAPAVRRPYRLHFFEDVDAALQRTLDAQDIACVYA